MSVDVTKRNEETESNSVSEIIEGIEVVSNGTDRGRKRIVKSIKKLLQN